jgi:hypothetical protein
VNWEKQVDIELSTIAEHWAQEDCLIDCERCPLNKKVALRIDDTNIDVRVSKCKIIDSLWDEKKK